jgi:hypothetical protein
MTSDRFRCVVVFTPKRLVSAGVVSGDHMAGVGFLNRAWPAIDEFVARVTTKRSDAPDHPLSRKANKATSGPTRRLPEHPRTLVEATSQIGRVSK